MKNCLTWIGQMFLPGVILSLNKFKFLEVSLNEIGRGVQLFEHFRGKYMYVSKASHLLQFY